MLSKVSPSILSLTAGIKITRRSFKKCKGARHFEVYVLVRFLIVVAFT